MFVPQYIIFLLTLSLSTSGYAYQHWTRHTSIGQGPRQEHAVAKLGSKLYLIGGVYYNNTYGVETTNRIEAFDTQGELWHVAAPLPQPVNHPNAASVGGKIYVLGSLGAGGNWTALRETYAYDPFLDAWQSLAPLPFGTERGSSAVGVWNNTIYLAGGMQFLEIIPPFQQNSVAWTSAYNVEEDTWTTDLPPLPARRQHVGGVVVGSTFYVIGGREDGIDQYRNTTFALDLRNPVAWRTLAPMPTARGSLACAAIKTWIYCFGGEGDPSNPEHVFDEVEAYDTESDVWYRLPPMQVPRHGTGAVAFGDSIYIPGGGIKTAMAPVGIVDSFRHV
ncbi:hypothetical protein M409DRAFT_22302 [Zasmidium cellare ATCC 36951]|uniref:Galactose oxidase n=1 Tax=Zasmidium cellare ATCC 36951 TaxID=1080233 RepID=A0A6A6CLI2_ZASCE|nr:uncharacterized protein M409DRAFT_22302 [Zasmidium cellare ATCC 36951]KAF2167493.1 hypothetical protein M409DRAFT_22302 [Zasmidium cellare ATCC 36951]